MLWGCDLIQKKEKKKPLLKGLIIFLSIILLAGAGYTYYVYNSVKETANKMHEKVNGQVPKSEKIN